MVIPLLTSATDATVGVYVASTATPSSSTAFRTDWSRRFYPDQDIEPWISEIRRLLGACGKSPASSCGCSEECSFGCPLSNAYGKQSRACRGAALAFVESQGQELQKFQTWLTML